ncbi:unnamed protein product [Durusdinium trenchii]|uniref:DUF7869 domain-containing protein n=1 Tax=Durusdinium trenchii TaxID=1381693 RepID=A0ABP0T127_9DINO
MRYIKKTLDKSPEATAECISFLESIYQSVAETLPDTRSEDDIVAAVKLQEKGGDEPLTQEHLNVTPSVSWNPAQKKESLRVNRDQDKEQRFLPPGRMHDYYQMMISQYPEGKKPASFATFYRAWTTEYPFMTFRTKRQHLECATCQRHRILLRSFAQNLFARREQSIHYEGHLRDQHRDRLSYWSVRAQARLLAPVLCLIVDGMDQGKFAYPRAAVMGGKQWANFSRPRAHIVACRIHGYGTFFAVSRADAAKDSNHHCEFISIAITMVQKRFNLDLSKMHCHIQSDNCVRETKNNTLARWCSAMTSRGIFSSCVMACLRTGHSHEDIDQAFGRLACWMQKKPTALRPEDFVPLINQFLEESPFPYEPFRLAFELNRVRDWTFGPTQ